MKKFYLAAALILLAMGVYSWKSSLQQNTGVADSEPSVDETSPLVTPSSVSSSSDSHDNLSVTNTLINQGGKQSAETASHSPSNPLSGNSFSGSGFEKDFGFETTPNEPNLSNSPVFGHSTALAIPEIVRDFSKAYDLKILLDDPSPIKELFGVVALLFRTLHELNSDIVHAVADVAVFDPDAKQWRRMTGKEAKDFTVSNPYEFEFNPRDGTFQGDIHESVLPMRLHQTYWSAIPLVNLRRLSCRGTALKNVERGEFTGKITGDVFVKVFADQGKPYTERKVGSCTLSRR